MSIITLPDRPEHGLRTPALRDRVISYFYVMYALMMHDIKNRFFGSGLGQIVLVLWPFVHIVVLLTIYVCDQAAQPLRHQPHPVFRRQLVSVHLLQLRVALDRFFGRLTNRSFLQYRDHQSRSIF